ncbi:MAG: monovalent cation/H+ antiporter subunit D [Gemmatimonadota bacterium]
MNAMPISHWLIAPVVLPFVTGAALLLVERRAPKQVAPISLGATVALLLIACTLLARAWTGEIDAYLVGNWRAPFGIALALDRLTALMLTLTAVVALASVLYARGGDDARGAHFHSLLQFQLMGLNGAFLTADLFNLFVFFEVLLIASYGLLLHGAGAARLRAAIHYVAFNLTGSALFLVAVASLYGLTGTLNMADLAHRVPQLGADSAQLVRAAALLLLVVFCVKAALLPLYFWLPDTYGAATAPVAALFAIMTKVGVYAVARMYTLVFGDAGGIAANVAQPWLPALALTTVLLGALGALAAPRLRTLVAYLVVASAGTLLLGVGLGRTTTTAAALFYLVNSTLVAAALFLLIDRIGAMRGDHDDRLVAAHFAAERPLLGAAFLFGSVAVAGLPPLGGFLGKAMLLEAAWSTPYGRWVWVIVLLSSFGVIVALARAGSLVFWRPAPSESSAAAPVATTARVQAAAIGLLLAALASIAVLAQPVASYATATANQLFDRRAYIDAVLQAEPVPPLIPIRDIAGGKP